MMVVRLQVGKHMFILSLCNRLVSWLLILLDSGHYQQY
jgi:hypothetical protein